ncbi:MAG: flagellar protein FhlB [Spirochaetaceae bacterium]|nr:MAG: flagellar protein FhlB [Spirochaetaceae bacterium]
MDNKKAVAVQYLPGLPAPFIVAKGRGKIAEKITEIARIHGITLVDNVSLADRLEMIDIGSFIPEEYYAVIAEILVFAGRF